MDNTTAVGTEISFWKPTYAHTRTPVHAGRHTQIRALKEAAHIYWNNLQHVLEDPKDSGYN